MFYERDSCDFIKGYRCRGERCVKVLDVYAKWFKCDSYVSDYVFAYCCDMVDLMRWGLWTG